MKILVALSTKFPLVSVNWLSRGAQADNLNLGLWGRGEHHLINLRISDPRRWLPKDRLSWR